MIKLGESNFSFAQIGQFVTDKDWIHPSINQRTHQIIFVTSGEVHIVENDIFYNLKSGDTLFLEAGKTHFGFEQSTGFTSFFWMHFLLDNFSCFPDFPVSLSNYTNYPPLKELIHNNLSPKRNTIRLDLQCANIIQNMCDVNSNEKEMPKLARDIFEWVRINASAQLCVNDVSNYFKFTPEYIGRITKKHFNSSIKKLINSFVTTQAKNMLSNSNYSIKEISSFLEFSDANSFIKFFKYHVHITPTEYRNSYSRTVMNNNSENKANGLLIVNTPDFDK